MKPNRRQRGRNGMELAEEAVHLLRMNSSTLPAYYIGSLPFMLGLLYFWADMSRSPFAVQHLPGGSLGLALLFLWMKFWQAVFVNGLRARIAVNAPPRWTVRRVLRVFLIQTAIQPSSVLVLPLALLPVALGVPWVFAFYQNVTVFADGETGEIRQVFKRASRQARLWPGQNVLFLFILAAFVLCIFINLASVCDLLPHLLKMLLGIESVYTQSMASMFNTTFLAAICGLTYLCVDPIIKTAYLLRCFYGESLDSGEDLKAELKQFAPSIRAAIALWVLLASLVGALSASAADSASPAPPASVKPALPDTVPAPDLDRAISDVIHQSKYTWRMPRKAVVADDASEGPIGRFILRGWQWTKDKIRAFFHWIGDVISSISNWLDKFFHHSHNTTTVSSGGVEWITLLHTLYFVLLAVVISALFILIYRGWQLRRRPVAVAGEAIMPTPDLADENVGAEQLPEDGWLKLGRELLGRGELRLALREFYFASLTQLASRNLITIAKFKSNRDYVRELGRRGHSLPQLLSLFGENVSVFDRSWYGLHEVNPTLVDQFLANVERMRSP